MSPDDCFGHPALRSLDSDCAGESASASPSWLRLSAYAVSMGGTTPSLRLHENPRHRGNPVRHGTCRPVGQASRLPYDRLQPVMPQRARAGSGSPRTVSPDVRCAHPGLHSLDSDGADESASASPSWLRLSAYAGSTGRGNPEPPASCRLHGGELSEGLPVPRRRALGASAARMAKRSGQAASGGHDGHRERPAMGHWQPRATQDADSSVPHAPCRTGLAIVASVFLANLRSLLRAGLQAGNQSNGTRRCFL